jgi:peptidase E
MRAYLIGGGDIKAGELEDIDRMALSEARNQIVYVIDLTSNDEEKLAKYRDFLTSYFKGVGAEEVRFISTENSLEAARERIGESGLVYIPGGDTGILAENLKKRKLGSFLKSLESVIVGNSAGALVACDEAVLTRDEDVEETKVIGGMGLVPFSVDVHYDASHDVELIALSSEREIYGIPEGCAIVYDGGKEFIGDIWKFSGGKKEKVH